ncbi:hypothetical protein [Nocardiopsis sp. M1B1]|uniref:hypothetical protein n=1 Tax=Nocardiopsis sp. M1B1 TaxID=3450454 RepID=UPI004039D125
MNATEESVSRSKSNGYMMQKKTLFPKIFIVASAIALLMSTGVSTAAPTSQTGNLETLGTEEGSNALSSNLVAEVHQAQRDEADVFLSVTWSIENTGESQAPLAWLRDGSYTYSGQNFAGVTAMSPEEGTRYRPIMDEEGYCLCSGEESNELIDVLNPGEKIAYWSLFSVPDDIDSVTVEIPNFDPIEDIPIS